jgi:GDP-4-dehydro-6-deoxy-D-mannose reductase
VAGDPLITGAAGFAGSHLLDRLSARGAVWAWSHARTHAAPDIARVRWQAVDLLDRETVRRTLADARPGVIYHCAGIADVRESWHDPALALQVNVIGTHNLLEGVRTCGLACPVLVTGSGLVYQPSSGPIHEDHPIGPSTIYGVSKLAQELAAQQSALPVFICRPFNHAGPRQSTAYVTSAFAEQLAKIEAGAAEPVLRVGNLESRRDITDVRDTVAAYEAIVERGSHGRPYNVCSGRAYRIQELLDILRGLARVRVRVERDPTRLRPSDNPVVLGSHDRLTRDTGWRPIIPIEQTLSDLLDFWRTAANAPASSAATPGP